MLIVSDAVVDEVWEGVEGVAVGAEGADGGELFLCAAATSAQLAMALYFFGGVACCGELGVSLGMRCGEVLERS